MLCRYCRDHVLLFQTLLRRMHNSVIYHFLYSGRIVVIPSIEKGERYFFEEARNVVNVSPRSAAALLRPKDEHDINIIISFLPHHLSRKHYHEQCHKKDSCKCFYRCNKIKYPKNSQTGKRRCYTCNKSEGLFTSSILMNIDKRE